MKWQTQRCLLTGATGGIGQAVATELAVRGVSLILQGRNLKKLQALHAKLPGEHCYVVADITDPAGRNVLLERISLAGGITMLINNAGISKVGLLEQSDQQAITDTINTNLLAPMLLTQALLPQLKSLPQSYIINIGSAFGSIGFAGQSLYCASKFGLRGFSEALYRELADTSVKVSYLAPRATATSINSAQVVAMNQQLGSHTDTPVLVANALIKQLEQRRVRVFIGFEERLFAKINGVFPTLVDKALLKKLPIIKRFIAQQPKEVLV